MKCQLELSESRGVKFSLKLFPPNKNGYFGKHNWRVHAFEYFKICEEKFNFKEAISIFFSFFLKSGYQHMLFPFFYSPKYSSVVKKDSNPNQLRVVENLGLRLYCMQSVAFDSLSLLIIQVFFYYHQGEVLPFKSYLYRFPTPYAASKSSSPLWYAIRRASAHIIVLSSYSPFGNFSFPCLLFPSYIILICSSLIFCYAIYMPNEFKEIISSFYDDTLYLCVSFFSFG